jgi:hypothetical protein
MRAQGASQRDEGMQVAERADGREDDFAPQCGRPSPKLFIVRNRLGVPG